MAHVQALAWTGMGTWSIAKYAGAAVCVAALAVLEVAVDVGGPERALVIPDLLPFAFDVLRECRVVTVCGFGGIGGRGLRVFSLSLIDKDYRHATGHHPHAGHGMPRIRSIIDVRRRRGEPRAARRPHHSSPCSGSDDAVSDDAAGSGGLSLESTA